MWQIGKHKFSTVQAMIDWTVEETCHRNYRKYSEYTVWQDQIGYTLKVWCDFNTGTLKYYKLEKNAVYNTPIAAPKLDLYYGTQYVKTFFNRETLKEFLDENKGKVYLFSTSKKTYQISSENFHKIFK